MNIGSLFCQNILFHSDQHIKGPGVHMLRRWRFMRNYFLNAFESHFTHFFQLNRQSPLSKHRQQRRVTHPPLICASYSNAARGPSLSVSLLNLEENYVLL